MVNRTDCCGRYTLHEHGVGQTTDKRYTIDLTLLKGHFAALAACDITGLHTTRYDPETERCWSVWLAVDIDCHGPADSAGRNWRVAQALHHRAIEIGLTPLLLDSNGKGGFHFFLLFSAPTPTELVYTLGQWLVRDYHAWGLPQPPETFPKQARIKAEGDGSYGNWVRLPGRHHKHNHYTRVWSGERWLAGTEAIEAILAIEGTDPSALDRIDMSEIDLPSPEATEPRTKQDRAPAQSRESSPDDIQTARDAIHYVGDHVDYEPLWIRIGWCLTVLGEEGLKLWDEWSRGSKKYKPGECAKRWARFRKHGLTLDTLFYLAEQRGWQRPTTAKHKKHTLHEATDDPHRLARLFLDQHYRHRDGLTLRYMDGEWLEWDRAYRTIGEYALRP